ncbi:MAG: MFS transporter [Clostridia bacterium]|nr:MFS transporter [Clostridia bacterium]
MGENEIIVPDACKNAKKLSKETKEKIFSRIFFNIIFLIVMMGITLIINFSYTKMTISDFEKYIKIVQVAMAIISIVLFEIAYRKDTMKIGLIAIEFVIFGLAILFVPYMYIFNSNTDFLKLVISAYAIYYVAKSIVSSLLIRSNYLKDNMSDVKEIVKDEKKGYLDEESKKTLKERKLEEENAKKLKNKNKEKIKNSKNEHKTAKVKSNKNENINPKTKSSKSENISSKTKSTKSKDINLETEASKSESVNSKTKSSKNENITSKVSSTKNSKKKK